MTKAYLKNNAKIRKDFQRAVFSQSKSMKTESFFAQFVTGEIEELNSEKKARGSVDQFPIALCY